MDMVCVCGKRLPIDNPTSICDRCLRDEDDIYEHAEDEGEPDYEDDSDSYEEE